MFHQPKGYFKEDGSHASPFSNEYIQSVNTTNNTYCIVERLDYLIQLQVQTNEMLYQLLSKKE